MALQFASIELRAIGTSSSCLHRKELGIPHIYFRVREQKSIH